MKKTNYINYFKCVVVFAISTLLLNCSAKESESRVDNESNLISIQDGPSKTITEFLKWYKINLGMQKDLVKIDAISGKGSKGYYSVDFKATEAYLKEMKSSGFLSDNYISKWRDYFKQCNSNLKNDSISEGPVDGFDYDFVLFTQVDEGDLDKINEIQVSDIKFSDNKATLILKFPSAAKYEYTLSKLNGRWFIDSIESRFQN